jgi:hypothetical protein
MTDPIQPGTSPAPTPPAPASVEPPLPTVEPAGVGLAVPAQSVSRDGATSGTGRRSTGVRWAIALVGVALVLGVTAAVLALTAGRPNVSAAVGYMPDDVVQYAEYRFDLPGDQRQKLASFLSAFPGFDDQSTFQTKLDETLDRLVAAASENEQTYTADIKPWFGGIIAMGSGPIAVPDGDAVSMFGASGLPLVVVTVTDQAKAAAWIESLHEADLTRGEYNGAILFSGAAAERGPQFSIAVTDKAILAGADAEVRRAVDSGGNGKLADDDQFQAAFKLATDDYVTFSFMDYQAYLSSYVELMNSMGSNALDSTRVDDELLSLVPAWFGSVGRFEDDALVANSAFPSVDIGFDAHNKKSSLLGWAPPGTITYGEVHDVGPAVTALLDRLRTLPEVAQALDQVDATTGIGIDGIVGWWGDTAIVVSEDGDGLLGGGVLIAPTDQAKARSAFDTLRGLLVLGGGQAGIKVRDVQHGDTTITVVDFSQAAGAGIEALPPGYKAELAFAVTDQVVVLGYGQAFVESVLDAGPGPSLAEDPRVSALVKQVGEENLGFSFVDVRRGRELIEAIAKGGTSPEKWSEYVKEYQPFLLPFDAMATSIREDGDLNRIPSVITVTEP